MAKNPLSSAAGDGTHPPSGPSTPPPPPGPKKDEVPDPREAARRLVANWPPLTPEQRLTIATMLRPDLPVGIQRPTVESASTRRRAA